MISESLLYSTRLPPLTRNFDEVKRFADEIIKKSIKLDDQSVKTFWLKLLSDKNSREVIDVIAGNSNFLAKIIAADLGFSKLLLQKGPDTALAHTNKLIEKIDPHQINTDELKTFFRKTRKKIALTCAIADCFGVWDLGQVTMTLSEFADQTLKNVLSHLLFKGHQHGDLSLPNPQSPASESGLICLGMGKLGAQELNYSSDIDIIIFYDNESHKYNGIKSPQEYFSKLVRDMVSIIEEHTTDGFVFRVDLRLRPDPGSTPPVISTLAAETYYESTGQNWERAAMIKARPVAGDFEAANIFLKNLNPFIWRRSLDFAAIEDIHSIKRQINAVKGGSEIKVPGHNVKLGRGGIREIEFFVQTQQLIWGGRDTRLRNRSTCNALRALKNAGHVSESTMNDLLVAYNMLRKVEHRLQMTNDQQTHDIPSNPEKLKNLSEFMGFKSVKLFVEKMKLTLHQVENHYATLFDGSPTLGLPGSLVFTGGEDHPDTLKTLSEVGFKKPETVSVIIRNWHTGRFIALRSERARELLTKMVPNLLKAFSQTHDPDSALIKFNDFLSGLPAGVQLLSLLHTNPVLFSLLSEIMGSAPHLAETLRRHPILFDYVLTSDFYDTPPNTEFLVSELNTKLVLAKDFEDVLDITRRQVNDRLFQTGILILRGHLKPIEAGIHLTSIADAVLQVLYKRVFEEFINIHGCTNGDGLAIVALGKLGGQEITVGSDLDLLFIYDDSFNDAHNDISDGKKSLGINVYYTRLGQRFLSAITAPTGQGSLYDVDMRLRPSGNSGPLASSLTSFIEYHLTTSWTWEQMALTRARVVCASTTLRESIEMAIQNVLIKRRNPDNLVVDVFNMRKRIARDRPQISKWDAKNIRGGLVDIEFIVQYLQLLHAHDYPKILSPNTDMALTKLMEYGLLSEAHGVGLRSSLEFWCNLQGSLRLTVGENFDEENSSAASRKVLAKACGEPDIETLSNVIEQTSKFCIKAFNKIIEQPAEKTLRNRKV